MAFQANAFQNNAFQINSAIIIGNDHGDWPSRSKTRSKKQRERSLDLAIEKATEPKRRKVVKELPWLAEPILTPVALPVPEFNPTLAALADRATQIQARIDQLNFNRTQEEADIELLLLAL